MTKEIRKSWKSFNYKTKFLYIMGIVWIILLFFMGWEYDKSEKILNTNISNKLEETIESIYREQARMQLKSISSCILEDIKDNNYKEITEYMLSIHKCWAEARNGWLTWDIFVFDRISKKMVYDNSPDCMKWWEFRDFNPELEKNYVLKGEEKWECFMHNDKKLCVSAMDKMYNIGNTDDKSYITWKFDGSEEWLESIVTPSISAWFSWRLWMNWVSVKWDIQLQIVLWTQKDEAFANFKWFTDDFNEIKTTTKEFVENIMNILWIILINSACMYLLMTLIVKENKYGSDDNNSL